MHQLRVTENRITVSADEIHSCHTELLEALKSSLEKVDVRVALSERSKSLKSEIEKGHEGTSRILWKKTSVLASKQILDVPATLQLDGEGQCSGKCGSVHLINIVLCLNNREGIGTNYMKLEVAAQNQVRNAQAESVYDENILGVMITLDESVLKAGSWDSAYADANEYSFSFQKAYKGLLKSNIIGLQLNLV
jgi:hypothetical protein